MLAIVQRDLVDKKKWLTLEEFVQTGDAEVDIYLDRFNWSGVAPQSSVLEIGSGIGRMTAALSRRFDSVVATDVDAAFLKRDLQTVHATDVPGCDRLEP